GDGLVYEPLAPLPAGSFFDSSNGRFEWIPTFEQAGDYVLGFRAKDASGATDTLNVEVAIADINRLPVISATNHVVLLGQRLQFTIGGTDPDSGETLTFSSEGRPDGASINATTGAFDWTPGPGQAGDYLIKVSLTDGKGSTTRALVVRATTEPQLPDVSIELT